LIKKEVKKFLKYFVEQYFDAIFDATAAEEFSQLFEGEWNKLDKKEITEASIGIIMEVLKKYEQKYKVHSQGGAINFLTKYFQIIPRKEMYELLQEDSN
jgi:hypothetical protein